MTTALKHGGFLDGSITAFTGASLHSRACPRAQHLALEKVVGDAEGVGVGRSGDNLCGRHKWIGARQVLE